MPVITADALCRQQFEEVSNPGLQDAFVCASDAEDYWFDLFAAGTGVLHVASTSGPMTVLDVGAGRGAYLAEAKQRYGDGLRAVGITAVEHFPEPEGVEYVYGDVQRTATWKPPEVVTPGSVDVAVSSLTFQHLIDPLAALRNTFALLKQDGHFFSDNVILPLQPATAEETGRVMRSRLQAAAGWYGCTSAAKPLSRSSSILCNPSVSCIEFNGHLRKASDELFEGLEAHIIEKPEPIIVYGLAPDFQSA